MYSKDKVLIMLCFRNLLKNSIRVFNYEIVRQRSRKPFWLGMAKSKKFRIIEKEKWPVDEENEYRRLVQKHGIILQSMRHFLKNENPLDLATISSVSKDFEEALANQILDSFEENEIWNCESAEFRATRLQQLSKAKSDEIKSMILKREELNKEFIERVDEIVRQEKIRSLSFITTENLEEAVEKCLSNIVEYNYAIDTHGNKYPGREILRNVNPVLEVTNEIKKSTEKEQSPP